ncbi:ABC transporter substrate-binding protein [uncultured Martelella sp.]|uniref:ABC transporter substrate-binding protein n=1 Tax=uncultured Martelella sp. TaxID=392331 RepID=UPI0029C84AEE|nr:ABC transporter substrate-binding protein [uncultured Martelella sp.]
MPLSAKHALTRRQFVAASLPALFMGNAAFASQQGPRLAVLDWAWAETVLALGAAPYAVAEAPLYNERVVSPALPATTIDLGLRSWPNMELLKSLHPGLIITQAGYGVPESRLEAIAPTMALPLFTTDRTPLALAESGMSAIAERLDRKAEGDACIARFDAALSKMRDTLEGDDGRPVLIVKFAGERMLDIYGRGSLFDDVLQRLGLENAWQETGNRWGFSTAGLDAVARHRDARLVIIEPGPPPSLAQSRLWNTIPSVSAGRVFTIPPTWVFGGLPSALRFGRILTEALTTA